MGQLATFDLVLLLILSNAVQNSMNGGDNSLVGGLISAVTLVVLNHLVGVATSSSRTIEILVEGRPQVLVHNGKIYANVLRHSQLTRNELDAAIRSAGCTGVDDVHVAILENRWLHHRSAEASPVLIEPGHRAGTAMTDGVIARRADLKVDGNEALPGSSLRPPS